MQNKINKQHTEIKDRAEYLKERADFLVEVIPYVIRFNKGIMVVKYGGAAMADERLKFHFMQDMVLLNLLGFRPVIVHGGGKEISRWLTKSGIQPEFVNGLRKTDLESMEIVEMVLCKVGQSLVTLAEKQGVKACSVTGKDGNLLRVNKKLSEGKDIGFVGEVKEVNPEIITSLLDQDILPIITPLGLDDDYNTYNVNADDAAIAIAKALGAMKLVFLTDTDGVMRDVNDPESVISELSVSEAKKLIEDRVVSGGMIPKLTNCIDAIEHGVSRVQIINGKILHSVLLEIFTDRGVGTAIYRDGDVKYHNGEDAY